MLELRAAQAGNESRLRLRELAAEFPGALRELDGLPTDELLRRERACDVAAQGGEPEAWVAWMGRYHELMRAALALKRGEKPAVLDEDLTAAFARPPGGRLNVVVFATLAAETGVTARAIADALFPPRSKSR